MTIRVFKVSQVNKGAKANTIAFEGVPDVFTRIVIFPLIFEVWIV